MNSPTPVCIGDRGYIKVNGKVSINITTFDGENWNENHFVDVLYVPKLKYNLFPVSAMLDKGLK